MLARTLIVTLGLSLALSATASADKAGCKDHPLFPTRMPNYSLSDCKASEFEGYDFLAPMGKRHREEGKYTFLTYRLDAGKEQASGVAVVKNYENAITKLGGKIVASDPQRYVNGTITVDGKEVWFEAEKGNGLIWLRVIEKQPMTQHIVADAAAMKSDLARTGHVAIEGIFFDFNKSTIKPESGPALAEIAKLLKADPKLKLWVVGHTDWVGKVADNVKLAQARADAVVKALSTTHGIAAARLEGFGMGPLAPVASNEGEAGRAKNRRVELVQQP